MCWVCHAWLLYGVIKRVRWDSECDGALLQLKDVYSEIFRVLKPGAKFLSYEWVSTKHYDPNNAEHVKIIDEINYGNGLPVRSSHSIECICLGTSLHDCCVNLSTPRLSIVGDSAAEALHSPQALPRFYCSLFHSC